MENPQFEEQYELSHGSPRLCGDFGPTVGDRVRLADTDLFIEVEQDFTTYGSEVKFGGK